MYFAYAYKYLIFFLNYIQYFIELYHIIIFTQKRQRIEVIQKSRLDASFDFPEVGWCINIINLCWYRSALRPISPQIP